MPRSIPRRQILLSADGTPSKQCSKCGIVKPLVDFHKNKQAAGGVSSSCKICACSKTKQWNIDNHDRAISWGKKYREVNRDFILARTNSEENRERSREHSKRYAQDNPERNRAKSLLYLQRMRENGGSHTNREWLELCERYGNRCVCCGADGPLSRDHIVPVSKGGSNEIANIQPLCATCNRKKKDSVADYRI